MLLYAPASTKKRGPFADARASFTVEESLAPEAYLRCHSLGTLSQFAPLLAAAAVMSCFVAGWILFGHVETMLLVGWTLLVIAGNWLMVRRIEISALLYSRREPPLATMIGSTLMIGLVAIVWVALPIAVYRTQPEEIRIVLAGAICAMMCGALAIAAAGGTAIVWSGILTLGVVIALHFGGGRTALPMTLLVLFQFGFILAVVRRTASLLLDQANRESQRQIEATTSARLMREYEERGTSCLWQTDEAHTLTYATPGIAGLLGRPAARLLGSALPALIGGNGQLGSAMLSRSAFNGLEIEIGDGRSHRAIAFCGTPIVDSTGSFLGYRGSCVDVTETRSSERRLRQLASLDVLTELPNRMRMRELLGEALLAARASGRPCAMLLLDLDGFKPINDTFGHPKGDVVLKTVAERLVEEVGNRGIVGRLGGDEFGIVLHDAQSRNAVAEMSDVLIRLVSEPYVLDTVSARIGLSIGSAVGPVDGYTVDELIKRADLALYEAKAAGRGTYRPFEHKMQTQAESRLRMEHDLRQALQLEQFRVYYQPLVDSQTQAVTGFEALIRWQHPVRGFVSPAEFVPLAEDVGLIHEIGEWVVRTATKDCAQWPSPISVAVNLSTLQLQSPSVPAMISDALARARLPANRLELEVTESVFLRDGDGSLDVLRRLRALGVRIALDDFGTGYSSLGYLNRTIFNKLKIDGSFVRGAAARPESVAIIQAIVTLANCFQMTITAEGIETADDYTRMQQLGCHQMQGYLFGRPVPFDRATELVGTHWSAARRLASA